MNQARHTLTTTVKRLLGILQAQRSLLQFASSIALVQASRLLTELITMQVVSPLLFGYWKLWHLLFVYAPLLQLGIPSGANRNIPFYRGRGDDATVQRTNGVTLTTALLGSVLAALLSFGVAWWSARTLDMLAQRWFPWALALAVGLRLWLDSLLALLRSYEYFGSFAAVQYLLCGSMLASIALIYRWHLVGLLGVQILAYSLGSLAALWFLRRHLRLSWDSYLAAELVRLGFPLLLVGLLYALLTTTDRMLIALLMDSQAVGYYGLAILLFSTLSLLPLIIGQYYYPKISRCLGSSHSPHQALALAYQQMRLAAFASLAAASLVALLLPRLLPQFLPQYQAGLTAAYALLPGVVGLSIIGGYANWLNAMRKQGVYLRLQFSTLCLNVLFSLSFFALGWELVGIALGSSLAYLSYIALLAYATRRLLKEIDPV